MSNQHPSTDFQLECFRAANDRLLFRVKRRENWLKLQLLVQVALLAFALGLNASSSENILLLSLPISFILTSLYASEDRLVGHIVGYLNSLSNNLSIQEGRDWPNLESSSEGKNYIKTTLPVRLLAQIFGFLILPLGIAALRFLSLPKKWNSVYTTELAIDLIMGLIIGWLLLRSYRLRQPS